MRWLSPLLVLTFVIWFSPTRCYAEEAGPVRLEYVAEPARGNLWAELGGGVAGGALATGVLFAVRLDQLDAGCDTHSHVPDPCGFLAPLAKVLIAGVIAPGLAAGGAMLGGAASGGEGRFGPTLLAAYACAGMMMLAAEFAAQLAGNPFGTLNTLIPAASVGLVFGGVVGYRSSARVRSTFRVVPQLSRSSAGLIVGGTL